MLIVVNKNALARSNCSLDILLMKDILNVPRYMPAHQIPTKQENRSLYKHFYIICFSLVENSFHPDYTLHLGEETDAIVLT